MKVYTSREKFGWPETYGDVSKGGLRALSRPSLRRTDTGFPPKYRPLRWRSHHVCMYVDFDLHHWIVINEFTDTVLFTCPFRYRYTAIIIKSNRTNVNKMNRRSAKCHVSIYLGQSKSGTR